MYDRLHNIRWDPTLTSLERCRVMRELQDSFQLPNFIETGTADGATCEYLATEFNHLYTIEIVPSLHNQSKDRLRDYTNVDLLLGDSTEILPPLLQQINAPCFFWLDGHFCGSLEARGPKDTPVEDELQIIFATGIPHVILVDDARLFGTDPAYPTVERVRELATSQDIQYTFSYQDDMMRIFPK